MAYWWDNFELGLGDWVQINSPNDVAVGIVADGTAYAGDAGARERAGRFGWTRQAGTWVPVCRIGSGPEPVWHSGNRLSRIMGARRGPQYSDPVHDCRNLVAVDNESVRSPSTFRATWHPSDRILYSDDRS
jgi:hypothetical protein